MLQNKLVNKTIAVLLALLMIIVSVPTVYAVEGDNLSGSYKPGEVLVSLKTRAPSVNDLLPGFEIESVRLLTPGSSSTVYHIIFVEKSKEIVQKAVEALKASPFVIVAEPNYVGQYLPVIEPATQPTESTVVEKELVGNYELGAVLVSLKSGSPSIESLLSGFEIESVRLLTPGSDRTVYHVTFAEKSEVIVQAAITALKASPFIISAEPNYIGQYLPVNEPTVVDSTEATEFADPLVEIVRGDTDDDNYMYLDKLYKQYGQLPLKYDEVYYHTDETGEIDWALVYAQKDYGCGNCVEVKCVVGGKNIFLPSPEEPFTIRYAVYDVKEDCFYDLVDNDYLKSTDVFERYDGLYEVWKTIDLSEMTIEAICGDANGDRGMDIIDATYTQRYLASLVSKYDIDKTAADVDGDGDVTIVDVTRIQRALAGICNLDGTAISVAE